MSASAENGPMMRRARLEPSRAAPERDDVPYTAFLTRICRRLIAPNPHLDLVADAFAKGALQHPARPMSDQELTRAIREFQNLPLSDASLKKLGARFAEPKPKR
jgi:hypothetical protein